MSSSNAVPTNGTAPATAVPTEVAKNAISSHGSRYPEKPKPRARPSAPTPVSQVSSRGGRYAFITNAVSMCSIRTPMKMSADQRWIDRTSHPKGISPEMRLTLS